MLRPLPLAPQPNELEWIRGAACDRKSIMGTAQESALSAAALNDPVKNPKLCGSVPWPTWFPPLGGCTAAKSRWVTCPFSKPYPWRVSVPVVVSVQLVCDTLACCKNKSKSFQFCSQIRFLPQFVTKSATQSRKFECKEGKKLATGQNCPVLLKNLREISAFWSKVNLPPSKYVRFVPKPSVL